MKEAEHFDDMKFNIAKIISDCKVFKNKIINSSHHESQSQSKSKKHIRTQSDLIKSLDFDSCVKNIRNKARSLYSSKAPLSPMLSKVSSQRLDLSQYEIQQSPKKLNIKINQKNESKSSAQLPRLLAKYHKAYSPKNASSSQKYSLIDRKNESNKKDEDSQRSQSYHSLLGERKKAEEMRKMLIMGKIVKQNVIREKKLLINKKKQRRLQSLNFKEITIKKTCLS